MFFYDIEFVNKLKIKKYFVNINVYNESFFKLKFNYVILIF